MLRLMDAYRSGRSRRILLWMPSAEAQGISALKREAVGRSEPGRPIVPGLISLGSMRFFIRWTRELRPRMNELLPSFTWPLTICLISPAERIGAILGI